MVTVTVDPPQVLAAFRAGLDARGTFLSDHDRRYISELELKETTDTFNEPYTPVVFRPAPRPDDPPHLPRLLVLGRPSNHELRCDLRELTREVRDRWEISGT
ncbi:MAG: hypothetical protein KY469_19780 [Actinobacteria bacterium]|nr:hypothetical protein [Actinomycetota bacterium]